MTIIINLGDEYFLKGTKVKVGTFDIVAIDWEHPNYGYFADAMLWYKSPHSIKWKSISIVKWANEYKNLSDFLKKFPEFNNLFDKDFDNQIIHTK